MRKILIRLRFLKTHQDGIMRIQRYQLDKQERIRALKEC